MQGWWLTACQLTYPLPFLQWPKTSTEVIHMVDSYLILTCAKLKKKIYVFDCMQYFYLIISKCYAHKTSLSMGFTTIIPSQGSLCFRTSFGYRRKYELALIHLNKVLIPRWRLEVLCIQIQCIVKSITVVWLKLTCDAPGFGSLLEFI